MEKMNDYNKAREVLTRVHAFLSNLCRDARCDDHCSECLGASDLADDVYDVIHAPPRNCDVGTAEEQYTRFNRYCTARLKDDKPRPCRAGMTSSPCSWCFARWAQMPYEEGETDGSK